jgi:hypothetical protein
VTVGCVAINKNSAKNNQWTKEGLWFHRQSSDPCLSLPPPVVWYGPKKI